MKEIKRDVYLEKLINRKENGLIKIVTGIRRCGKSYLLDPIYKNYLLDNGVKEDHIMENIIYNELLFRGYNVDVDVVEIRENDVKKQTEVDFVCNQADKRYYNIFS